MTTDSPPAEDAPRPDSEKDSGEYQGETQPQSDDSDGDAKRTAPIVRITRIGLAIIAVTLVWYILADRFTPYSDEARVEGYVVPIVPQVAGYLVEVPIAVNQPVKKGQVLARIDPRLYNIAMGDSKAQLKSAEQRVGARTASVKSAEGRVRISETRLAVAKRNYKRVRSISADHPGALSQLDRDKSWGEMQTSQAELASAIADLEKEKEQLGMEGPGNPAIRSAQAGVKKAKFDIEQTLIRAPSAGAITNVLLGTGHYAQVGQPLLSFVSTRNVWIEANMRENNIAHVMPGDAVEITLDSAPGTIFQGEVVSVGYGAAAPGSSTPPGELPSPKSSSGWLREPQRFPVIITLLGDDARGFLRVGGLADVVIYTGDSWVLNGLSKLRIRAASWLSYVR